MFDFIMRNLALNIDISYIVEAFIAVHNRIEADPLEHGV